MKTLVVLVISILALIVAFIVGYSIGYQDCEEDIKDEENEQNKLFKKIEQSNKQVEIKKTENKELDEVDQMVELFGYQGSRKTRGDK